MIRKMALGFATAAIMAACATPDDVASTSSRSDELTGDGPVRAGYVHALQRSRFSIGGQGASRVEHGMEKAVGDQGVFATLRSGMTLGIPNADAAVRSKPPFPGGADAHNKAVRSYLVSAGIPADQILEVVPFAAMHSEGEVTKGLDGAVANAKLGYYFSVIRRQLDGIPVVDSLAWARLDADGDVVMESVYWPEIPEAVIAQARRAQAKLADHAVRASLLAKVPGADEASLVIHHTPGFHDGTFEAVAVYDVPGSGGKVHHFDPGGNAVMLAEDRADTWGPMRSTPK